MTRASLICLPPAGAGPSLFHAWQRADARVIAPSLPGREGRFNERPAPTLSARADLLAEELANKLPLHYGLFGYSMGGTLAVLLSERLVARGLPEPEALFVLGAPSPDRLSENTTRLLTLDSASFWQEIGRIGGTPPEILHDPELRAIFEPTLRTDFAACVDQPETGPPLHCPVHSFVANEDHLVGPESQSDWQRYTTGKVHLHRLSGGHMLAPDHFSALLPRITSLFPVSVMSGS